MIVYRYPLTLGPRVPEWLHGAGDPDDDDRIVAHRRAGDQMLVALTADGIVRVPDAEAEWVLAGEIDGAEVHAARVGRADDPPLVRRHLIHPVRLVPGSTGLEWALPVLYEPTGEGYAFPRELRKDPQSGAYAQMVPEHLVRATSIAQIVRETILEGRYDDLRVSVAVEFVEELLELTHHAPRRIFGSYILPLDEPIVDAALLTAAAAEHLVAALQEHAEA